MSRLHLSRLFDSTPYSIFHASSDANLDDHCDEGSPNVLIPDEIDQAVQGHAGEVEEGVDHVQLVGTGSALARRGIPQADVTEKAKPDPRVDEGDRDGAELARQTDFLRNILGDRGGLKVNSRAISTTFYKKKRVKHSTID